MTKSCPNVSHAEGGEPREPPSGAAGSALTACPLSSAWGSAGSSCLLTSSQLPSGPTGPRISILVLNPGSTLRPRQKSVEVSPTIEFAVSDYGKDPLRVANVGERISIEQDEIRELAHVDRSQRIGHVPTRARD